MWPPWGLTQTSFGSPCFISRYRSAIGCWLSRSPLTRSIGADGRSSMPRARRERRPVGEEFAHRLRAVDRSACRVDIEKILAGRESLFLPLWRVVLVDADAVHYRAAQAVLLG